MTGDHNRLLSDDTYTYLYDANGNRTARFVDVDSSGTLNSGDTSITEYTWDHRNRLTSVTDRNSYGGDAAPVVNYVYDMYNRLIHKELDADGDGTGTATDTFWIYDGNQAVLQFDGNAAADLSHRYLWGPAVDQLLADETVDDGGAEDVLWAFTDWQGSVRHLASYDESTSVTSIENHKFYDAFGNVASETNSAVDTIFGYTGRMWDDDIDLQNNLNRWYDSEVGRFVSEDPIDFLAGDPNWYRYVGNSPGMAVDPSGLEEHSCITCHFPALQQKEIYVRADLLDPANRISCLTPLGNSEPAIGPKEFAAEVRDKADEWALTFEERLPRQGFEADHWLAGVGGHFIRLGGDAIAGVVDLNGTVEAAVGDVETTFRYGRRFGVRIAAARQIGLLQAAEARYGTDICTYETVDPWQRSAEAFGRFGSTTGSVACAAKCFGLGAVEPNIPRQGYTRVYRAVSEAEYQDIVTTGRFRQGPNSMEGKWFADSLKGAQDHGNALFKKHAFRLIEADVPDSAPSLYRLPNLDDFGPARYLDLDDLNGVTPNPR